MPLNKPSTFMFPVKDVKHDGFDYLAPNDEDGPTASVLLSTWKEDNRIATKLIDKSGVGSVNLNELKWFDLSAVSRLPAGFTPCIANASIGTNPEDPNELVKVRITGHMGYNEYRKWAVYVINATGALAYFATRDDIPLHEIIALHRQHPTWVIEHDYPKENLSIEVRRIHSTPGMRYAVVMRLEHSMETPVTIGLAEDLPHATKIINGLINIFGKMPVTYPDQSPTGPVKTLVIEDLGLPSSNIRFSLLGENGNVTVSYQGDSIFVMRKAIYWTQQQADARAATIQLQAWMNLAIQHSEDGNELQFIIGCNYNIPSAGTAMQFKLDKEICTTVEEAIAYVDTLERLGLAPRTQAVTFRRIFDRLSNFADPFHI